MTILAPILLPLRRSGASWSGARERLTDGGRSGAMAAGRTAIRPRRASPPADPVAAESIPGLPPFQGGAAGYIGYDFGSVLERLPAPRYDDLDLPDVVLGLYDWVIAWDHRHPLGLADLHRDAGDEGRHAGAPRRRAHGAGPREVGRSPRRNEAEPLPTAPRPPSKLRARHPTRCRGSRTPSDRLRSTFTHRGYLDAVAPGARLHRRGRHLSGEPLAAVSGAAAGSLHSSLYRRAAAPQSGAVRGLPRLRRGSTC